MLRQLLFTGRQKYVPTLRDALFEKIIITEKLGWSKYRSRKNVRALGRTSEGLVLLPLLRYDKKYFDYIYVITYNLFLWHPNIVRTRVVLLKNLRHAFLARFLKIDELIIASTAEEKC